MIELYLSKVTENSESEQAGKLYAGAVDGRLHARRAEKGRQAGVDRQDQGGDCSCQGGQRER